jgi:hypothetical protein
MKLTTILDRLRSKLNGRVISDTEAARLRKALPGALVPDWLIEILTSYPLTGVEFELSEEDDESELGAEVEWLAPKAIIEESTKLFPGIAAIKLGYLPIGECLTGSGDPYFLKMDGGDDPPLVRIPHEAGDGKSRNLDESQIEQVARSLSKFLQQASID